MTHLTFLSVCMLNCEMRSMALSPRHLCEDVGSVDAVCCVKDRKAAFDSARAVQGGKGLFGSRGASVLGEAHAEAGGHLIAAGGSPSFISVTDRTRQPGVSKPPG